MQYLYVLLRAQYVYIVIGNLLPVPGWLKEWLMSFSIYTVSLHKYSRSVSYYVLSTSLSAVSLSYFTHFISISIFSFYLWTPLSVLF